MKVAGIEIQIGDKKEKEPEEEENMLFEQVVNRTTEDGQKIIEIIDGVRDAKELSALFVSDKSFAIPENLDPGDLCNALQSYQKGMEKKYGAKQTSMLFTHMMHGKDNSTTCSVANGESDNMFLIAYELLNSLSKAVQSSSSLLGKLGGYSKIYQMQLKLEEELETLGEQIDNPALIKGLRASIESKS